MPAVGANPGGRAQRKEPAGAAIANFASFRHLPAGSIRKIVMASVNSERDIGERLDRSERVPAVGPVLNALVFGAGSRATGETLEAISDSAQRWRQELEAGRGTASSPFASDAEIYIISVSLMDVRDAGARTALLQVPTALTVLPGQASALQQAGRAALRASPEFLRLRASLQQPLASGAAP